MPLSNLGKFLIVAGVVIFVVGLLLLFGGRIPYLGRLPGDLSFRGKGYSIHIPIVTSTLLSIIITFILNLSFRK
jgi:hypothetical protein